MFLSPTADRPPAPLLATSPTTSRIWRALAGARAPLPRSTATETPSTAGPSPPSDWNEAEPPRASHLLRRHHPAPMGASSAEAVDSAAQNRPRQEGLNDIAWGGVGVFASAPPTDPSGSSTLRDIGALHIITSRSRPRRRDPLRQARLEHRTRATWPPSLHGQRQVVVLDIRASPRLPVRSQLQRATRPASNRHRPAPRTSPATSGTPGTDSPGLIWTLSPSCGATRGGKQARGPESRPPLRGRGAWIPILAYHGRGGDATQLQWLVRRSRTGVCDRLSNKLQILRV
ncbi:uncharacterized protein A4U43_C09F15690 [Asparagus officinalis]|uniref:Uncharacterized protein n=1 Tax=Asparagus officinalis TaxID=4686 RepID=A0A5P1E7N3_ASPOF|nr:uncharacterized protein A4U43_C09F15690 [Asparagus officinalis]